MSFKLNLKAKTYSMYTQDNINIVLLEFGQVIIMTLSTFVY